jgi:hypothetical protein
MGQANRACRARGEAPRTGSTLVTVLADAVGEVVHGEHAGAGAVAKAGKLVMIS